MFFVPCEHIMVRKCLLLSQRNNKCKNCIKMKNVNLFIQIAYYTHMGQAITIQKHANIKKKNNTNIINMLMFNYLFLSETYEPVARDTCPPPPLAKF